MEENRTRPVNGGQDSCFPQDGTFRISQDLIVLLGATLDSEVADLVEHVGHLKERLAGLRSGSGEDARRRLQNPRLRTTYVDDRIRALTVVTNDLREQVTKTLGKIVEPALKLEMAEGELAAAKALRAELDSVAPGRAETGLYPEAATAVDFLYDQFSVNRWHWSAAGPERLRLIAEILRQEEGLLSRDEREERQFRRSLHGLG